MQVVQLQQEIERVKRDGNNALDTQLQNAQFPQDTERLRAMGRELVHLQEQMGMIGINVQERIAELESRLKRQADQEMSSSAATDQTAMRVLELEARLSGLAENLQREGEQRRKAEQRATQMSEEMQRITSRLQQEVEEKIGFVVQGFTQQQQATANNYTSLHQKSKELLSLQRDMHDERDNAIYTSFIDRVKAVEALVATERQQRISQCTALQKTQEMELQRSQEKLNEFIVSASEEMRRVDTANRAYQSENNTRYSQLEEIVRAEIRARSQVTEALTEDVNVLKRDDTAVRAMSQVEQMETVVAKIENKSQRINESQESLKAKFTEFKTAWTESESQMKNQLFQHSQDMAVFRDQQVKDQELAMVAEDTIRSMRRQVTTQLEEMERKNREATARVKSQVTEDLREQLDSNKRIFSSVQSEVKLLAERLGVLSRTVDENLRDSIQLQLANLRESVLKQVTGMLRDAMMEGSNKFKTDLEAAMATLSQSSVRHAVDEALAMRGVNANNSASNMAIANKSPEELSTIRKLTEMITVVDIRSRQTEQKVEKMANGGGVSSSLDDGLPGDAVEKLARMEARMSKLEKNTDLENQLKATVTIQDLILRMESCEEELQGVMLNTTKKIEDSLRASGGNPGQVAALDAMRLGEIESQLRAVQKTVLELKAGHNVGAGANPMANARLDELEVKVNEMAIRAEVNDAQLAYSPANMDGKIKDLTNVVIDLQRRVDNLLNTSSSVGGKDKGAGNDSLASRDVERRLQALEDKTKVMSANTKLRDIDPNYAAANASIRQLGGQLENLFVSLRELQQQNATTQDRMGSYEDRLASVSATAAKELEERLKSAQGGQLDAQQAEALDQYRVQKLEEANVDNAKQLQAMNEEYAARLSDILYKMEALELKFNEKANEGQPKPNNQGQFDNKTADQIGDKDLYRMTLISTLEEDLRDVKNDYTSALTLQAASFNLEKLQRMRALVAFLSDPSEANNFKLKLKEYETRVTSESFQTQPAQKDLLERIMIVENELLAALYASVLKEREANSTTRRRFEELMGKNSTPSLTGATYSQAPPLIRGASKSSLDTLPPDTHKGSAMANLQPRQVPPANDKKPGLSPIAHSPDISTPSPIDLHDDLLSPLTDYTKSSKSPSKAAKDPSKPSFAGGSKKRPESPSLTLPVSVRTHDLSDLND